MFKKFKIGKKLVLSFILVTVLASISGIVSVAMMKNIDANYSFTLVNYGFSQGDVGKALSAFCRIDGNVHDAISYMDESTQTAARNNVAKQSEKLPPLLDAIEATLQSDTARGYLKTARSAWENYLVKANELIAAGTTSDSQIVKTVQVRLVEELDPLYMDVYDSLQNILENKVENGSTASTEMTRLSGTALAIVILLIAASMTLSILFGIFISRAISKPVQLCSKRILQLARGDLQSPVPTVDTQDEIGTLANATQQITAGLSSIIVDIIALLDEMGSGNFTAKSKSADSYIGDFAPLLASVQKINSRLSSTLAQISQSADQVAGGSDQVSSGAQALSQGATEQASAVEELAATITEISSQVKSNAENAIQASKQAGAVGDEIVGSNQQMHEMTSAMSEIRTASQEIGKIIKTIEDIAFQTNILALNAAVEAARAGAAGKGFAVVADEVRNLASKSADASQNTSALIENSIRAVENGTRIADQTAEALSSVVDGAKSIIETLDRIAEASKTQSTAIEQVTQGVDQISSVVQTNSATAEQSAAASEELSSQAQIMKGLVGQFRLTHDPSSAPSPSYPHSDLSSNPISFEEFSSSGKY